MILGADIRQAKDGDRWRMSAATDATEWAILRGTATSTNVHEDINRETSKLGADRRLRASSNGYGRPDGTSDFASCYMFHPSLGPVGVDVG